MPGFVRRSWGPGWALVGDAGYFKDPITTHGMTDALRDAELLADEILEALAGERAGAGGARRATRPPGTGCRTGCSRRRRRSPAYDWDVERVQAAAAPGQRGDERRGRVPGESWSRPAGPVAGQRVDADVALAGLEAGRR